MAPPVVPPTTEGQQQLPTCLPQPDPNVQAAFFRYWVNDRSFIRGAARLLAAPITQVFPTMLSDVIVLDAAGIPGSSGVQTLDVTTAPTGGTFTLALNNVISAPIQYNDTAANIQTALEALSTIGTGNVTVTGGPIGTAPVVATFGGALANMTINQMAINDTALTGGNVTVTVTNLGSPTLGLYDAMPGWCDLGATKNGITISVNNAEETFDIDQQLGIIGSQPTSWTVTVATALAESSPERMQVAWEGSGITIDNTPASGPEEEFGVGSPYFYTQRRLAVLYQRPSRLIRGYFFRIAQRTPAESTITFAKTGDQQTIPMTWNILPDNTEPNVLKQFFIIRDQSL
jgi:hypothetical protein